LTAGKRASIENSDRAASAARYESSEGNANLSR
jgi:hypothetical protein